MNSFLPLIRSEWRLLLFGFAMTFASSLGQTYFISLFSGEIRADIGLSHGEFGGIYSGATLLSAVLLLWTGTFIDRLDLRRLSYILVIGLASGCMLMATSQNSVMLFMSIFMLRHLGQGLMDMTSTTTLVRYLDQQKGKANALGGMGYSVSEALLPTLVVGLMFWLSWRESWVFWAGLMVVVMPLLIWRLLHGHDRRHQAYLAAFAAEHTPQNSTEAETLSVASAAPDLGEASVAPRQTVFRRRQWTRAEVIRDPQFYLFLPALMTMPMLFTGFMFHQVHLVAEKGWSLALWGSLYLVYALISLVMKLITGVLIDRFGAVLLLVGMTLPMALGLLILAGSNHVAAAVLFMLCLGVSAGIYSITVAPFFSEQYGNKHLGAIKSLSASIMVFASATSPVVMGWLIDRGVSIDRMALWSVAYIVVAVGLAAYAYWWPRKYVTPATEKRCLSGH